MREDIKKLRKKAVNLEPLVRLGKKGINDSIMEEIKKMLKKRKLIKIKLLRNFVEQFDVHETIEDILKKTGSVLVSKTGFVFVLYKEDDEQRNSIRKNHPEDKTKNHSFHKITFK